MIPNVEKPHNPLQSGNSFAENHLLFIDVDVAPADDLFFGGFHLAVVDAAGNLQTAFLLSGSDHQGMGQAIRPVPTAEGDPDFIQTVAVEQAEITEGAAGGGRQGVSARGFLFEQLEYVDNQSGTLYILVRNRWSGRQR